MMKQIYLYNLTIVTKMFALDEMCYKFAQLYTRKNKLTTLEILELFLREELGLKTVRQNVLRRRRARLLTEKSIEDFDFGFHEVYPKHRC